MVTVTNHISLCCPGGYLSLMIMAVRTFWYVICSDGLMALVLVLRYAYANINRCHRERRPLTRPQIILVSITIAMFSASTTLWALDLVNIFRPIHHILNGSEDALLVPYWQHPDVQNVWFTQSRKCLSS